MSSPSTNSPSLSNKKSPDNTFQTLGYIVAGIFVLGFIIVCGMIIYKSGNNKMTSPDPSMGGYYIYYPNL